MGALEQARARLCLALDVPTVSEAEKVVAELRESVGMFKVGLQLFTSEGPQVVNQLQALGGKIFLDLKYHDIPNTVAEAARVATRLRVAIFNLHATGGEAMMKAAVEAASDEAQKLGIERPAVLAVTVLTSLSAEMLRDELAVDRPLPEQVVSLAGLAQRAGLDGVVASPQEIVPIRQSCGDGFIILTPGIRPAGTALQDQQRVMTPQEAVDAGANYIVIGRPIMKAADRVLACRHIVDEMAR